MITLNVDTSGIDRSRRFLVELHDQLPFASSLALNATARDVQLAYRDTVPVAFVNPVAFTRNAFRYDKSSKADLEARVYPAPDRRYYRAEIFGGQRRWKSYEGFLRGLAGDSLPSGKLLPTRTAVNAAGNPKRSLFGQIQSGLSTTDRGGFFIGSPRGGSRAPGVYRRSREKLIPFFLVADSEPSYRPRFPFERVGQQTVSRVYSTNLAKAIDRAVASAR